MNEVDQKKNIEDLNRSIENTEPASTADEPLEEGAARESDTPLNNEAGRFENVIQNTRQFVASAWNGFGALIRSDYRKFLFPNAVYIMRIAAFVIAFLAIVSPLFESSMAGFAGWLFNLVFNLCVAMVFLVVGEVLMIQAETRIAVNELLEKVNTNAKTNVTPGSNDE